MINKTIGEDDNTTHAYTVEVDGNVYNVVAVDAWTAERKARKLFRDEFGFEPMRVYARMGKAVTA